MTTEEMLLQLIEGQKQMSADISNLKEGQKQMSADISNMKKDISQLKTDVSEMKEDISELKRESKITRVNVNHNGEVLESLTDQLTALNIADVKY